MYCLDKIFYSTLVKGFIKKYNTKELKFLYYTNNHEEATKIILKKRL